MSTSKGRNLQLPLQNQFSPIGDFPALQSTYKSAVQNPVSDTYTTINEEYICLTNYDNPPLPHHTVIRQIIERMYGINYFHTDDFRKTQ